MDYPTSRQDEHLPPSAIHDTHHPTTPRLPQITLSPPAPPLPLPPILPPILPNPYPNIEEPRYYGTVKTLSTTPSSLTIVPEDDHSQPQPDLRLTASGFSPVQLQGFLNAFAKGRMRVSYVVRPPRPGDDLVVEDVRCEGSAAIGRGMGMGMGMGSGGEMMEEEEEEEGEESGIFGARDRRRGGEGEMVRKGKRVSLFIG